MIVAAVVPLVTTTIIVHFSGTSHVGPHGEVRECLGVFFGVVTSTTRSLALLVLLASIPIVVVLIVIVVILIAVMALVVSAILVIRIGGVGIVVATGWVLVIVGVEKKTLYSRLIVVAFATLLLTMLIVVLIVVLVVVAVLLIVGIVGMLAVAIIVMTLRMTRHDGWLLGCPRSALILTKSVLF